jgi:Lysine-specific metallo-endopeptidase
MPWKTCPGELSRRPPRGQAGRPAGPDRGIFGAGSPGQGKGFRVNKFSEAFAAARDAVNNGDFTGAFQTLKPKFVLLLGSDGPVAAQSKCLENLRFTIKSKKWELVSAGKGVSADRAGAQVIVAAAGAAHKKPERAATLKMLRHLYHVKTTGGQVIWVYSPPVAYSKWIFDEVAGASDVALETVLMKEDEVYTEQQQSVMAAAVQEARKFCIDVMAKLGTPDAATTAVVKRYFGNASTATNLLTDTMTTLRSGYQKIANACNSGSIVISDEPGDRTSGGWKDWAFVYSVETMSVIYLQGAWLEKADQVSPSNQGPLHRCVRTVIHELSHKVVSTEDIVYGPKGLKPEGSTALTPEYALHNADSWAYFAVDVLGYLTGTDKENGNKSTTAILKTPVRTLTAA